MTKRQKEIIKLIKLGYTFVEIADELGVCKATVVNDLNAADTSWEKIVKKPLLDRMIKLYHKHGDYSVVAKKMNLNYQKVYYHLRGIK